MSTGSFTKVLPSNITAIITNANNIAIITITTTSTEHHHHYHHHRHHHHDRHQHYHHHPHHYHQHYHHHYYQHHHFQSEDGRCFVALSLAEAECMRGVIHMTRGSAVLKGGTSEVGLLAGGKLLDASSGSRTSTHG